MDEHMAGVWSATLPTLSSIHVLGAGLKADRPAHRLFHDLGPLGWRLVPIHPKDAGHALLGRPIRAALGQGAPPEIVVFFLSPSASLSALLHLIRTTHREDMPLLWFQPGAVDEELIGLLDEAEYTSVTETCIVRFIQAHELAPTEPHTDGPWYKQVMSAETACSIWTVHQPEDQALAPSQDTFEWCGDELDLERSEHVVPRYIRSLARPDESVRDLGLRLAAD